MVLSLAEVEKIAHLARLELSEAEKEEYQGQLSAILDYAARLNELDLENAPATAAAVARQNVMREDIIQPSLPLEQVLYNAPSYFQEQFQIQPALEETTPSS